MIFSVCLLIYNVFLLTHSQEGTVYVCLCVLCLVPSTMAPFYLSGFQRVGYTCIALKT